VLQRRLCSVTVCILRMPACHTFFQPSPCLRNPLIPTSIINQSTTRVSALIYATFSIYLLHIAARLLPLQCHASRQVAIVPVFRCARTPHCCLPKHRGPPRDPSSRQPLSRRPKGKRVMRDGPSLRTVTAAPCWQMPRNRPDCSAGRANLSGSPVISLPGEAPPEKAIPGVSFLSLHESARVVVHSDRLKGLPYQCVCACVLFF